MPGIMGADTAAGYQPPRDTCIIPTVMPHFDLTGRGIPGKDMARLAFWIDVSG